MKDERGYILLYIPEHPRAKQNGCVYEHMLVAEEMMGRELYKGEEVHHLDFNESNNREDNLLVLTASQHAKLHAWLKNGAKTKNDPDYVCPNVYCKVCKKILKASQAIFCSPKCSSINQTSANKPDKETLKNLIKTTSFVQIAKTYSVSDNAVRKWCKSYDLPYLKKDIKLMD